MSADDAGTRPDPVVDHAGLMAASRRGIENRVADRRAADRNAVLLLAGIGLTAPVLSTLPTVTVARSAGAGLALAVVLLVAVLLPCTGGWPRRAGDPDAALPSIWPGETPHGLEAEYERLGRITAAQYVLVRLALIVLALTASITAIAASTV
ncbi:hypothetical protein ACIRL2_45860 [Embleya sp. NPDC127516]|uniref:hypothetical protein n=1 Tax=Embleya sp. NPDC127516 TaxID=3363990 RepID=UPI00382A76E7